MSCLKKLFNARRWNTFHLLNGDLEIIKSRLMLAKLQHCNKLFCSLLLHTHSLPKEHPRQHDYRLKFYHTFFHNLSDRGELKNPEDKIKHYFPLNTWTVCEQTALDTALFFSPSFALNERLHVWWSFYKHYTLICVSRFSIEYGDDKWGRGG